MREANTPCSGVFCLQFLRQGVGLNKGAWEQKPQTFEKKEQAMDNSKIAELSGMIINKAGFISLLEGKPIKILVEVVGEEFYVFFYEYEARAEVLRTFGRFAANPELNLEWANVASAASKISKDEKPGERELPKGIWRGR